jgi:hypothetical protein
MTSQWAWGPVDVPPVAPTLPKNSAGPAISFSFYFKTKKPPVSQGVKGTLKGVIRELD